MDCITDTGDVAIVYNGVAEWGPLRLHYSSLLESRGTALTSRQALRAQDPPSFDGATVRWRSEALDADGIWTGNSAPLQNTVFRSADGSVEWNCFVPHGRCELRGRAGCGYAEHLRMTVAPWKLPIRTLRWGRFAAPDEWLVWIEWIGEAPYRVVYRNGGRIGAASIEDDCLDLGMGDRLLMDRSLVLREGALGTTALSSIPGLRDTFPARLLDIREHKWRSRARLERTDAPATDGWAIHERVEWPF